MISYNLSLTSNSRYKFDKFSVLDNSLYYVVHVKCNVNINLLLIQSLNDINYNIENALEYTSSPHEKSFLIKKQGNYAYIEVNNISQQIADININVDYKALNYKKTYANINTDALILGADSNPPFSSHPVLDGWYYKNTVLNGVSNLYFYGNTLTNSKQKLLKLSDIKSIFIKCKILSISNNSSIPFINIYTRPTGSGDAGAFYKSRITYIINQPLILPGEDILMCVNNNEIDNMLYPEIHKENARLLNTVGSADDAEDVILISVNTDSGAALNTVEVIYSEVGFKTSDDNYNIIELSKYKENKIIDVLDYLKLINEKLQLLIDK